VTALVVTLDGRTQVFQDVQMIERDPYHDQGEVIVFQAYNRRPAHAVPVDTIFKIELLPE
jgi:hypothetical protein